VINTRWLVPSELGGAPLAPPEVVQVEEEDQFPLAALVQTCWALTFKKENKQLSRQMNNRFFNIASV
jgi:hypothetical protein